MPGKARLITVIPVGDGETALARTLDSLAAQTVRPDRVLVVNHGGADNLEPVASGFAALRCEWRKLGPGHRFFDACNTGLSLATNTRHLHLLRAGDTLQPAFYETLIHALGDGDAFALAFCLEETLDTAGRRVGIAGWRRRRPTLFGREAFLKRMMRLTPLPVSTALIRTGGYRLPVKFRTEITQLAHQGFWASFAAHCVRIVRVNQPLCTHHWAPAAAVEPLLPGMQPLVYDELRVMQNADHLREQRAGWWGRQRMLWTFCRRAALKTRRAAQMRKPYHAREIARAGRSVAGWWRWLPAVAAVTLREWIVFGLLRRRRHPRDLYR